jgi:MORN repeat
MKMNSNLLPLHQKPQIQSTTTATSSVQPKNYKLISDVPSSISSETQQPMIRISQLEYPDGRVYVGKVFQGTPHGLGNMMHPDGSCYKGEFLFGLIHGKGHYSFLDGSEYQGEFSNGLKHGRGCFKKDF